MLSISIVAEEVFQIGSMPITNSLLTTWIGVILTIILVAVGMRKKSIVPRGIQLILEAVYSYFVGLCENVLGDKNWAEKAAPFITTIFIFVFMANIFEVVPGVGTIGIKKTEHQESYVAEAAIEEVYKESVHQEEAGHEEEGGGGRGGITPLFRPGSADLNFTLALAVISVLMTQIVGFKVLGFRYLKKFFNFSNPINFFVGVLELISEFAKIISFSFRLFGNIFAGEVLLTVILMLVPYFVPIPFYGLELFVAVIQAFVFAMLTLVFIKLATISHDHDHDTEHAAKAH